MGASVWTSHWEVAEFTGLQNSATIGPLPQQCNVSAAEARVWFRDFQYTSNTLCYTEEPYNSHACESAASRFPR